MYRRIIFILLMACFLSSSFVQAVPTRIYNTTYPNKYYRPYGYQPNSNKLRSYNHDRHLRHNNNFIQTKSVFSDINALEKYTLNRNYNKESDLQRLQRLEMQAFGAIQSGDINSRYDNVRNAILSRPQNNYKSSLWRNIGNYFSGQMTGYTPSFDFNNDPFFSSNSNFSTISYPPNYGNRTFNQYSSPFGSGYHFNNYGVGNNASIRILD